MSQEKRKVCWRLWNTGQAWEHVVPRLNVTFPSQNLQGTLNYSYIYILYFCIKIAVHPAREVSPSGPGPCRADISLLKAPSSASRASSRALSSGFCSSTLLPEVSSPSTRCPGTRTTSTALLEGHPGSFCALFLSLVHTHAHTHMQGKIRSDKACRWKLGNGAIIVSHVILIQAFVHGF